MAQRTITLTGRPPVTIDEDQWPVVASASVEDHDGKVRCQANRTSNWFIKVRQHADGRTLVYAGYDYSSNWEGERGHRARRGVLLPGGPGANADDVFQPQAIVEAIREVCQDIATCEHAGTDADRWRSVRDTCIADMPAEAI
jgi:hypothetical protein